MSIPREGGAQRPIAGATRRVRVPEKPGVDGLEARWGEAWESAGTYRFDPGAPPDKVFAIDTPPPTVSGSLHIGHAMSYTHTDVVARFWRMRGRAVLYPMGWDDNGLPTERRVQNYFGVRCDPGLPYDPGFEPPSQRGRELVAVSRPNFVELCHRLTAEDERAFEHVWRTLGLSVDWSRTYTTIGDRSRRASQLAFLRMLARDEVYQHEAPTLWDVDFHTAVSQAELEDRERPGAYHRIRFALVGGDASAEVQIETTRPVLLPACVALVAHPEDGRYRPLFGRTVRTPLFGVEVPVVAHALADPEKGTGIAMVCTFGDTTDIVWWRELHLPTRTVVGRDGRLEPVPWGAPGWESDDLDGALGAYGELVGRTVRQAQERIVELLSRSGDLVGEPRAITHPVKFYEKGERPLEIVSSRQWFVRTLQHRQRLLERGEELHWHPGYMAHRYRAWVEGLNSDWNISRQRFFGVPFPVWYALDDDGAVRYDRRLLPQPGRLPVDPSTDVPDGYAPDQRGRPGGFVGDPDVMDTWATSSLTPLIVSGWEEDPELFARVFPMDLRPQAHDIIRTWLFATVVRSELELGALPWSDAAISGFVVDPDRKKMSKSTGNATTPLPYLERHGADAVRYWAAGGKLGTDTALDEGQMKVGRRLAIKILNASKFVLGRSSPDGGGPPETPPAAEVPPPAAAVIEPIDRDLLRRLGGVVTEATSALAGYDHSRALELTEGFFWSFCDDYLELVKNRSYGDPADPRAVSARTTLVLALSVQLRLFAPFLPYVTEEVWSWWQAGSVHLAPWPDAAAELEPFLGSVAAGGAPAPVWGESPVLDAATEVLAAVRKEKTTHKRSMRARVASLTVVDLPDRLEHLRAAERDLLDAGGIEPGGLALREGGPASVTVVLDGA
ncbi:MAG TPA: valine--tRNA ligase [Acidimicrobiales bacterium]|nr:valine--tRNA ligase [Acidimicrobiales bacterium]